MQKSKRFEIVRNVLVLATLVGFVLLSLLLGHVLRYSFPALWHPPIQETDPRIKVGMDLEFEGIRRQAYTYFTSLPAKCLAADGRFVKVGETGSVIMLLPPEK